MEITDKDATDIAVVEVSHEIAQDERSEKMVNQQSVYNKNVNLKKTWLLLKYIQRLAVYEINMAHNTYLITISTW